jgi:hypothetical protein
MRREYVDRDVLMRCVLQIQTFTSMEKVRAYTRAPRLSPPPQLLLFEVVTIG